MNLLNWNNYLPSLLQEAGAIWLVSSSLFQIKIWYTGSSVWALFWEYQLLFPEWRGFLPLVKRLEILTFWPAGWLARVDLARRATCGFGVCMIDIQWG